MKKSLLLPILATSLMFSQAWSAEYQKCTSPCSGYCKWPTGGCDEIGIQPGESWSKSNCQEACDNCTTNGSLFSDDACRNWTGQGKDPSLTIIGCCKWDTETNCYPIMSNESDKVDNCKTGANKYWSVTTCPTSCPSTPPNYDGTSGNNPSSTSTQTSSGSSGVDPIISYNSTTVTGLNVTHFANSLQIASGKDATVFLFDIRGKQMFSQKVLSGTTTISLAGQRQGVYYAVVKAGAQKQTVKIILK